MRQAGLDGGRPSEGLTTAEQEELRRLRRENRQRRVERLAALDPDDSGAHYDLACTRALLGRGETALAALVRAVEAGRADAADAAGDPDRRSLHGLPEFGAILDRMRAAGDPAAGRLRGGAGRRRPRWGAEGRPAQGGET